MAADLYIHVFSDGELKEKDFAQFFSNAFGSRWFNPASRIPDRSNNPINETASIWIGEVSWLKAALFDNETNYVPSPVQAVSDCIGEHLPVIDDSLIEQVTKALSLTNATSYGVAKPDTVCAFLLEHKGKRAFTVSW